MLVFAELANPRWISVPMVGWKHVEAITEFADVHLVTHARNRENILAAGFPAEDVTFIDGGWVEECTSRVAEVIEGRGAMGGITQNAFRLPQYYEFELAAWRMFEPRLRAGEFDLVHRVTPVSPGVPSLIAERVAAVGVPFVLGPINGGVPWPRGYETERRQEGEWLGHLRGLQKILPYYHSARRHSSAILVGSAAAWRDMPRQYVDKLFYVPENAIDPAYFSRLTSAYDQQPLGVAFVGRLVACKGTAMLLEAAASLVRAGQLHLDIIGDGPQRPELESLASQLGVRRSVRLDGWVPHEELQDRLIQSCVLGFPSIREFGGAAVMEAMMLGLIPVVVNYGGPGEVVDDATGFRVELGPRERVVADLEAALRRLVAMSSAERREMGERARARIVREYSRAAKRDKTRAIYEWLLGERDQRPALEPPPRALELY